MRTVPGRQDLPNAAYLNITYKVEQGTLSDQGGQAAHDGKPERASLINISPTKKPPCA